MYSQGIVYILQVLFLQLVMGGIAGTVFAVLFLWVCFIQSWMYMHSKFMFPKSLCLKPDCLLVILTNEILLQPLPKSCF
jgi:hypothetical protein